MFANSTAFPPLRATQIRLSKIIFFMDTILPDTNEQTTPQHDGAVHTTGMTSEESDQQGAMPREERHGQRRKQRESGRRNLRWHAGGQGPRHQRGSEKREVVCRTARSRRDRRRLGIGSFLADAAIPFAVAAGATGGRRAERRLGRRHRLKPDNHQAQNDGGYPFHAINLADALPAKPTAGWLWRVTFCPLSRRLRSFS